VIKFVALWCVFLSLITAAVLFAMMVEGAQTLLVFMLVLLLNLLVLAYLWKRIFLQKSVGLTVMIIIFKYPILAYILWQMSRSIWFRPIGLLAAILAFVAAVVLGHVTFRGWQRYLMQKGRTK
jgi:hypothetical protein